MLLEPARHFQTLHRATVIFGADVALRAVLRDNVRETRGHDEDGQAGGDTPGVVDAVGGVIGVSLKVDVAAALGPDTGHAIAGLVGAEGSGGCNQRVSLGQIHEGCFKNSLSHYNVD